MEACLLDTDMLSEILKQRNPTVALRAADYLRKVGQFAFSAMSRYEIARGHLESGATLQAARFTTFCQHSMILPVTDAVLDVAATLWVNARRLGHPHSDADLIIAATALEQNRVLVTGNTAHFAWIPGLKLDNWRQAVSDAKE